MSMLQWCKYLYFEPLGQSSWSLSESGTTEIFSFFFNLLEYLRNKNAHRKYIWFSVFGGSHLSLRTRDAWKLCVRLFIQDLKMGCWHCDYFLWDWIQYCLYDTMRFLFPRFNQQPFRKPALLLCFQISHLGFDAKQAPFSTVRRYLFPNFLRSFCRTL